MGRLCVRTADDEADEHSDNLLGNSTTTPDANAKHRAHAVRAPLISIQQARRLVK